MAKTIASLEDGRVVPWFSEEDSIPQGYVEIPSALLAKFNAGKFTDGIALAKAALSGDTGVDVEPKGKTAKPHSTTDEHTSFGDSIFGK